jgi:hypothetical protein
MGTKSKCEIHLFFIYSLWTHRVYLGYKKLSIEFNNNLKLSIDFIYIYICTELCSYWRAIVSDFEGFQILEFRIRDTQPVVKHATAKLKISMDKSSHWLDHSE